MNLTYTVNADESCTTALSGSSWFRMCITYGGWP